MWNLVDSDSTTIIVDVKLSRQWQYDYRQWQYDYYRRCET